MAIINKKFTNKIRVMSGLAAFGAACLAMSSPAASQNGNLPANDASQRATYADLVSLAERSSVVLRAKIRRQKRVPAERAPGLEAGFARLYIEAETLALLSGRSAIGESLVYLVDVPLNSKGKPPKLKKTEVLLFANQAGRSAKGAAQLQLTGKHAQLRYSPAFEARLRPVLADLAQADVPPVVEGIRDALAVQGTLTGESETQIFLRTADGSPVSVTVLRRPRQPAVWGVSWGEIIDSAARAPEPQSLRWYRLACSLPEQLPSSANLARDPVARRLAASDYSFVRQSLGPCTREITLPVG